MSNAVRYLVTLLRTSRLDLSDEKRTQAEVASLLSEAGIPFARERKLGAAGVIDFLVEGGIGLEIKLNGAKRTQIEEKLLDYAGHPDVAWLLLATNRAIILPATILGKPVTIVSLGVAWL